MSNLILAQIDNPFNRNNRFARTGKTYKGPDAKGKLVDRPVVLPVEQAVAYPDMHQIVTMLSVNQVPNAAFTTGTEIQFKIGHSQVRRVGTMSLRFKIQETSGNSMYLAPTGLWFDRIELWSQNPQNMLFRMYGDCLFFKQCALTSTEQFNMIRKSNNISANYSTTYEQIHPASATKYYRYDFWYNILEGLRCDLQSLNDDLLFRIFPRSSGIVVSGSGIPSCLDLNLLMTESDDNANRNFPPIQMDLLRQNVFGYQSLQPDYYEDITATLTQGQKYQCTLRNFRGYGCFLQVLIRAANHSNANNGNLLCYDLGPNGQVDVVDGTQASLLCNGSPITPDWFREVEWPRHFDSQFGNFTNQIFVPFCKKATNAFAGQVNGFLQFDDSEKYLTLVPDSNAPTNEVQTVTLSGTAASGEYCFSFKGDTTGQLAYNASTTTMNAALNALPFFYNNGLTCSCSAAATASFTITISGFNLGLLDGSLIQVIANSLATSAPAAITTSTARTTPAVRGFTTGSYYVTVYGWMYRSVVQNGDVLQLA